MQQSTLVHVRPSDDIRLTVHLRYRRRRRLRREVGYRPTAPLARSGPPRSTCMHRGSSKVPECRRTPGDRHDEGVSVFTPADEPYLGRQSVLALDEMIVQFLEAQRRSLPGREPTTSRPLQRAASELIPGASSVALSVRELVRQGYRLSALILTTPLMERAATISYPVRLWS